MCKFVGTGASSSTQPQASSVLPKMSVMVLAWYLYSHVSWGKIMGNRRERHFTELGFVFMFFTLREAMSSVSLCPVFCRIAQRLHLQALLMREYHRMPWYVLCLFPGLVQGALGQKRRIFSGTGLFVSWWSMDMLTGLRRSGCSGTIPGEYWSQLALAVFPTGNGARHGVSTGNYWDHRNEQ